MAMIRVIRNDEFEPFVHQRDCIPLVEDAFRAMSQGQAEHPAKYHDIGDWGLWFFMGGNVFPHNATAIKLGFAAQGNLTCQVLYYDGQTGEPKALLEGLRVTNLRTGAAAAIGAKYLARPESTVAGFVGAGKVCWSSLAALSECFALEQVYVSDADPEAAAAFVQRAGDEYSFPVQAVSVEEAVRSAQIVISATPSREPIVQGDWVQPGTHISAMGSDGKGKQEFAGEVHQKARIFCDNIEQCLKWGDINNSVSAGIVGADGLAGELGEVILGQKPGRTSDTDITEFDGTGLGVQDAVVAKLIYDTCVSKGLGTEVEF